MNEKTLVENLEVVVNEKKLTKEQVTILSEAVNGHFEIGVQYESYLDEVCGIDVKEQKKIVEELHNIFC